MLFDLCANIIIFLVYNASCVIVTTVREQGHKGENYSPVCNSIFDFPLKCYSQILEHSIPIAKAFEIYQ